MAPGLFLALLLQSATSVAVPQLSQTERGAVAVGQTDSAALAGGSTRARGELATAPSQIGDQQRTAASAPALSTSRQSRSVATQAVGGYDRCDPALSSSASTECKHALETRSGEYASPGAAPVTAEGRLLLLTDPQPGPNSVDATTRRLGNAQGLDALAGSAANDLAGAINGTRGATNATTLNVAPGTTTALPAGVPSAVVLTSH